MRRIPLSRRSHITGFRPVDGEAVEHESALERDFVLLVNFLDAGAAITSQPITIEFQDGARLRRYTPDFRVIWSDGRSELVEVKYRVDLRAQWVRLRPGFVAARAMARENGGRFRIATERGIRGPLLDMPDGYYRYAEHPSTRQYLNSLWEQRERSPNRLLSASSMRCPAAVRWRWVWCGGSSRGALSKSTSPRRYTPIRP